MDGYDQSKREFLVPFDLRKDVIDPLHVLDGKVDTLTDGQAELKEQMEAHVAEATAARIRRKALIKKTLIWTGSTVGPGFVLVVLRLFGVSF